MKKTVESLMTSDFIKARDDELIYDVVSRVATMKNSLLVCVVDKAGKITGVVTPREILKTVEVCGYEGRRKPLFSEREVAHIMTSRYVRDIMSVPEHVKPGDDVQKAIDIMIDRGFYEVPVVDEDLNPIGLIHFFAVISNADWRCDTGR